MVLVAIGSSGLAMVFQTVPGNAKLIVAAVAGGVLDGAAKWSQKAAKIVFLTFCHAARTVVHFWHYLYLDYFPAAFDTLFVTCSSPMALEVQKVPGNAKLSVAAVAGGVLDGTVKWSQKAAKIVFLPFCRAARTIVHFYQYLYLDFPRGFWHFCGNLFKSDGVGVPKSSWKRKAKGCCRRWRRSRWSVEVEPKSCKNRFLTFSRAARSIVYFYQYWYLDYFLEAFGTYVLTCSSSLAMVVQRVPGNPKLSVAVVARGAREQDHTIFL